MEQTINSQRIRIEKIELQNFRGVSNGIVEFNCLKTPIGNETSSDILGLYGQNGSGKTTLLDALRIAKRAMMGKQIPYDMFGSIISQDSDHARMTISFQVMKSNGEVYHLEYAFSLGKWEIAPDNSGKKVNSKSIATVAGLSVMSTAVPAMTLVTAMGLGPVAIAASAAGIVASQIIKSSNTGKEVLQSDGKTHRLVIFDEVLSLSGTFDGTSIRLAPIFDTRTDETVFLPKAKQKAFFPSKTAAVLKELQSKKKQCLVNSESFIFCDALSQLIIEQGQISAYAQIIVDLKAFAISNMWVLANKVRNSAGEEVIPLFTANKRIPISKSDSTTYLTNDGLKSLQTALNALNVVLQQIIPGLTLEAVRQVDIDLNDRNAKAHATRTKVVVYSVRDNVRIPIGEESAGIIRLISSLGLLSFAFVNPSVTVAIDEIDAGVYEYLLGELLLIFEEYGSGQLIFTCHNLRPMEVLNKKYIYFTTTNPNNRYLKPKSIRNENNLRDVYLREIIMGGQEEDLYTAAKHGKIASAMQKAGDLIGKE